MVPSPISGRPKSLYQCGGLWWDGFLWFLKDAFPIVHIACHGLSIWFFCMPLRMNNGFCCGHRRSCSLFSHDVLHWFITLHESIGPGFGIFNRKEGQALPILTSHSNGRLCWRPYIVRCFVLVCHDQPSFVINIKLKWILRLRSHQWMFPIMLMTLDVWFEIYNLLHKWV